MVGNTAFLTEVHTRQDAKSLLASGLLDFLEAIFSVVLNKIPKGRCLSTSALPAAWVQMLFLEVFTFFSRHYDKKIIDFIFRCFDFLQAVICVSLVPHTPP